MPISKIELKSYGFQIGDDSIPTKEGGGIIDTDAYRSGTKEERRRGFIYIYMRISLCDEIDSRFSPGQGARVG